MRVLVVTNMLLSGNGNWVAEQVRSLRGEGVDTDLLFFDTKRSRLNYATQLPAVVRAVGSGRYDVIHTHHTYTLLMVDMAARVVAMRPPVILTNHEPEILDREGRTRTWHPSSRLRHSLAVKRFAARRADRVIFVAAKLARALAFEGPYDVIPCGVDLEKFRPLDRTESRRRLGIPERSVVVFFPADPRNPRKRFALAQAAHAIVQRRVPGALLLTGGGIHADEMPYHYNAADVVVQTSFTEASPTVVKEALACEVPVVSTDAGDTGEILDGVAHCAVCLEDAGAIAAGILNGYRHRAAGSREHLRRKELGLDQVARRIITVYHRALGQRERVPA